MKGKKLDDKPCKLKSSSSRQNFKLESINLQTTRNNSNGPATHNGKKIQPLQKGDKTKSALLRHLKIHSLKAETEKNEDSRLEHHPSPPRHILQKIQNGQRRKDQASLQNKDAPGKSFMIRKKNLSGYTKKQEQQYSKYEIELIHLPKIGMHQLLLHSQNLKAEENRSSNSNSSNEIKDNNDLRKEMLHSSVLNQTIGLKIKPIICKGTLKENQPEHSICQNDKQAAELKIQKHIEKMMKKVRKTSKCEKEAAATVTVKEEEKPRIDSKEDKTKGFNGCKTIRISWGEKCNKDKKVQSQDKVDKDDKDDKDDIFGGLSAITHNQAYGKEIQSLKELFKELNHNSEVPTIFSKQLIDY